MEILGSFSIQGIEVLGVEVGFLGFGGVARFCLAWGVEGAQDRLLVPLSPGGRPKRSSGWSMDSRKERLHWYLILLHS
jgi:hypothetical protein